MTTLSCPRFARIALIGKTQTSDSAATTTRQALLEVAAWLKQRGHSVVLEANSAQDLAIAQLECATIAQLARQSDLAVVVGGDGTMLAAARALAPHGLPLVGINQGHLGFITDIALEQVEPVLAEILCGNHVEERRSLVLGEVMRASQCVFSAIALNDVVINRGGTSGLIQVRICIDGHFVAEQRADGLIICTPTGSTAYSLSAGGSLLHPALAGWALVPIAPHRLSNRPIVVSDDSTVEVELIAGKDASVNFDMQSLYHIEPGDRIVVRRAAHSARFLHPKGWNYFNTLREKLHWNKG